jgi:hypothetical protein
MLENNFNTKITSHLTSTTKSFSSTLNAFNIYRNLQANPEPLGISPQVYISQAAYNLTYSFTDQNLSESEIMEFENDGGLPRNWTVTQDN